VFEYVDHTVLNELDNNPRGWVTQLRLQILVAVYWRVMVGPQSTLNRFSDFMC